MDKEFAIIVFMKHQYRVALRVNQRTLDDLMYKSQVIAKDVYGNKVHINCDHIIYIQETD